MPGDRQGGTAGVEILSEGLEMPVLVDYDEACTSGLTREVYSGDLLCHVTRGSMGKRGPGPLAWKGFLESVT